MKIKPRSSRSTLARFQEDSPVEGLRASARGVPFGSTAGAAGLFVPCVYCRADIPADSFAYWSRARRLLTARCLDCERTVTLGSATWRRWVTLPRRELS